MLKTESITLATLADTLNVSTATVSRALSGKPGRNAERIKKLAQELNFTPNLTARNLRQSSSHTVGVLITKDISSSWYSQLVCKLEEELAKHGKTMQLSISRQDYDKEQKCLDAFRGSRVDGIIIGPVFRHCALTKITPFTQSSEIPVVCFSCIDDLPVNYVTVDYCEGAKVAVDYFFEKGHRDIMFIGCPKQDIAILSGTRLQGFNQAMFDHGLPVTRDSVISSETSRRGGWQIIKDMLATKRKLPTAMFCHNDEVAFGAMLALQQAGVRVPEDISIIGYDDLSECSLSMPPLTTVGGKMEEQSKALVKIMSALGPGHKSDGLLKKVIKPKLIERDSVVAI